MPRPSTLFVLVIGSTGAFGAAVTLELLGRGVHVRILTRDLDKARRRFGNRANAEYLVGDALDDAVIAKALAGCHGVVHTLNLDAAAQCERAARLLALWDAPANVAGADTGAETDVASPTPSATGTRSIRSIVIPACLGSDIPAAAASLEAPARSAGAHVILQRTGRFYGSTIRNSLTDSIFRSALEWRTIRTPGSLEARYPWTYAPDAARAAVDLLSMACDPASGAALPPVTSVDFVPATVGTQRQFLETVGATAIRLTSPAGPDADPAASQHAAHVGTVPRWKIQLAALTNSTMKGLLAEASLWTSPPALDGAAFARLAPDFVHTPLELAARTTLTSYR